MATLSAAMVALLTANWAGAGAAPTFGALIDFRKDLGDTTEQVIVRLPIHEDVDPINDILSNFKYVIQLRIKTDVSEDRLKVLTDETIRIINSYAITGITRQFAKRGENTSDRRRKVYSYDVWASLEEHASTGGTSYSSPGAGDVDFPANVTNKVNDKGFYTGAGDDIRVYHDGTHSWIISSTGQFFVRSTSSSLEFDATASYVRIGSAAGNHQFYDAGATFYWRDVDDSNDVVMSLNSSTGALTLTKADLSVNAALMLGSANAAWVPCVFAVGAEVGKVLQSGFRISNVDAQDDFLLYTLPLPTTKGALKLYIGDFRVSIFDADVNNYVTNVILRGLTYSTATGIGDDASDRTAQGLYTTANGPVDVSGYEVVAVNIATFVTDGAALDIADVAIKCYYA